MTAPKKKKVKAGTTKEAAAARRAAFVEQYFACGQNGTEAAIRCGLSERTAGSTGARMLKDVRVKEIIAIRRAELQGKMELTTENVLRELARVAMFDVGKCYHSNGKRKGIHELDEDTRRAIASITEKEFKPFGKERALGLSMQYLGLLPKNRVSVNVAAQSTASAEVSQLPVEKLSDLEVARRIAFVLSKATPTAPQAPTTTHSGAKQPA